MDINSLDDWNLLLQAAQNGDSQAQIDTAFYYNQGLSIDEAVIVQANRLLAFQWIKAAYGSGDVEAVEEYAHYLTDREHDVSQLDVDLGMTLYEICMANGSSTAAFNLGLEYRNKQQFDIAFELYQKSNRSDGLDEGLMIGLCYHYGIGVGKDQLRALTIFESVDLLNATPYEVDEANYLIGQIYLAGDIVEQDIQKARHYLELADTDGDHRSAQELLILIGRSSLVEK